LADAGTEAAIATITDALNRPVVVDFVHQPLSEAIEILGSQTGVAMDIDQRALDDLGVDANTPVTLRTGPVRVRSALELMLKELDLTWVIESDALIVTTNERAEENLVVRVYPVRDLVWTDNGHEIVEDYQEIIDAVTNTVDPDTWDSVGGPGSIQPLKNSGAFLVSQTWQVHERLERVLTTLRRVRRIQGIRSGTAAPESMSDVVGYQRLEPAPAPTFDRVGAANASWQIPRLHQPTE
jgi:hypothetical protein